MIFVLLQNNSNNTKVKKLIPVIFLIIACLGGCEKQENKSNTNALKIRAGFMCGWGSGEDSLYISNTVIKYVYSVPAQSGLPKINKTRATTETEWANIINSLDLDNFIKLNYNSCNICVDGCDEWIKIQDDQISHQIRFGMGSKIDSISDLQTMLAQYRSEFNK
jgi:hypothetical protein